MTIDASPAWACESPTWITAAILTVAIVVILVLFAATPTASGGEPTTTSCADCFEDEATTFGTVDGSFAASGRTFKPENAFRIEARHLDELPNQTFSVVVLGHTTRPLSVDCHYYSTSTVIVIRKETP